mgnify:CR=1 FL=1
MKRHLGELFGLIVNGKLIDLFKHLGKIFPVVLVNMLVQVVIKLPYYAASQVPLFFAQFSQVDLNGPFIALV